MSAPVLPYSRIADKRVAIPIMSRPAVDPTKASTFPVEMPTLTRAAGRGGARASLLNMMTLQEDVAAAGPSKKTAQKQTATLTPMAFLNRDSEEDVSRPVQDPIGTRSGNVSPARPAFSTDAGLWIGGHYLRISGIKAAKAQEMHRIIFSALGWTEKLLGARPVGPSDGDTTCMLYLRIDSIHDAAGVSAQLSKVESTLETDYVLFHEYSATEGNEQDVCQVYDGQVTVIGEFVGQISQLDTEDAYIEVQKVLVGLGTVLAIVETGQTSTAFQFRVEFDKISVAHKALALLTPEKADVVNNWKITAKEMVGPLMKKSSLPALQSTAHLQDVVTHSPSGRTAWSQDADGNCHIQKPVRPSNNNMAVVPVHQYIPMPYTGYPKQGRPCQYRPVRAHSSSADIYLDRIRIGLDIRTTVMLRNIPNSWGFKELKARLDEVCGGLYDFSYLRIDFNKHTNVGYGFVNFVRAIDIVPLYEGLYNQPWIRGGRGRKCNLSYATIQSIECLVEKFRNSSVNSEAPPCRGKWWWTHFDVDDSASASRSQSSSSSSNQMVKHGNSVPRIVTPDMVGTERIFPESDNAMKLQRSNDNAARAELYHHNRHGRGGSYRSSQSTFDLGNTRQMREDFAYPPPMPMPMPMPMPVGYPQVPHNAMMNQYQQHQQYNNSGHGGNNYQTYNSPGPAGNHRQYQNGGGNTPRNGPPFASNDARNNARMPRSFSRENLQAAQARGSHNQRGGRIYNN